MNEKRIATGKQIATAIAVLTWREAADYCADAVTSPWAGSLSGPETCARLAAAFLRIASALETGDTEGEGET